MLGSYLPGRPQDVVASRVSKLTLPRCEVNRWRRVICDGVPGRRRRHGDGESGRHGGPVNLQGSGCGPNFIARSEEHTSELQSLMRISYAVFCLKKKKKPGIGCNTGNVAVQHELTQRATQTTLGPSLADPTGT